MPELQSHIAATEQMLPGMQACVDAAIISKMADRGQIKGALIDGPLAMDVAIDKESCEIKKLKSPVAGDADCILFPNIESGNVFYPKGEKFATDVIEECAAFPHGEYDDYVDSMTQAVLRYRQGSFISTYRDYVEEDRPPKEYKYY